MLAGANGKIRAYQILLLTVLLRPLGNLALAWGMRQFPDNLSLHPILFMKALANPFVATGIALLILALLTRMALLSVADLSVVLPLTAVGYIITTVLAKVFLNEQLSLAKWLGVALIFCGVALVSSTSVKSRANQ